MPHITARFLASGTGTRNLRELLRLQKSQIRTTIAEVLGYPVEDVTFFSSQEDPELTDNALPLEIVIDSGVRTINREQECVDRIKELLVQKIPGLKTYHFGIWLKTHERNEFIEHKPTDEL